MLCNYCTYIIIQFLIVDVYVLYILYKENASLFDYMCILAAFKFFFFSSCIYILNDVIITIFFGVRERQKFSKLVCPVYYYVSDPVIATVRLL